MTATEATDVVSIEEARRQLSLDGTTDRDDLIRSALDSAVSLVSRQWGLPLIEEAQTWRLLDGAPSRPRAIMAPIGWPAPVRPVAAERTVEGGRRVSTAAVDDPPAFERRIQYGAWAVSPAAFGWSEWPTGAGWTVQCVYCADAPARVKQAVTLAMRAFFYDDDLPQNWRVALIR